MTQSTSTSTIRQQSISSPLRDNFKDMLRSRIETFAGTVNDDTRLFVKQVKYTFVGKKHCFDKNPENFDDAQITVLILNTTGKARKWIWSLDNDVTGDWDKLTIALEQRFPHQEKKDVKKIAIKELLMLQQETRSLNEYCEAGRDILWCLGDRKEWNQEVTNMLIDDLADKVLKRVVGGTLEKSEYNLDKMIEIIQEASRDKDESFWTAKSTQSNVYHNIKLKDCKFVQFLHQIMDKQRKKDEAMLNLIQSYVNLSVGGARNNLNPSHNQNPYGVGNNVWNNTQGYQGNMNNYQNALQNQLPWVQYQSYGNGGGNRAMAGKPWRVNPNVTCFQCRQQRHIKPDCTGPPLLAEDQEQICWEISDRLRVQAEARWNATANSEMTEQYCGPQAAVAVQIEVGLSYESVDEWGSGDRAPHTMQSNAIKIAVNVIHIDINANMGDKWTAKEAEFKSKWSSRTRGNTSTSKTTRKKKAPHWQLAGLEGEIKPDLISILNKKVIQVSMMQYININSSAKAFISKVFKLKLKSITTKTIRSKATGMTENKWAQMADQVEKTDKVSEGARIQAWLEQNRQIIDVNAASLDTSVQNQNWGSIANFYIKFIITLWSSTTTLYNLQKTLIDGDSALNLISVWIVEQIGLTQISDNLVIIWVANRAKIKLSAYCCFKITVEGVSQIIETYVVPYETSYFLLLRRVWMRIVSAIEDYHNDNYWISDDQEVERKLTAILSIMAVDALKVRLNQQGSLLRRTIAPFNEEMLQNLKAGQHVIADAIWDEVLKEAEDKMDEETDEYEIKTDEEEFSEKEIHS